MTQPQQLQTKKWYQKRGSKAILTVILILIVIGVTYVSGIAPRSILNTTVSIVSGSCTCGSDSWTSNLNLDAGRNLTMRVTVNSGDGPISVTLSNSTHHFFYTPNIFTTKTWELKIPKTDTYYLLIWNGGAQTASVFVNATEHSG